jgi:hypothetical protein
MFFKVFWTKLKNFDNERWGILGAGLCAIPIFLVLCLSPGLIESQWFVNLLIFPAVYGTFIAIGAYLGRMFNLGTFQGSQSSDQFQVHTLIKKNVRTTRPIGLLEKALTIIGFIIGIGLAIACCCQIAVPFASVLSVFAYLIFVLGYACNVAGLFNRLGSAMDGTRLKQEKKAILISVALGVLFSALSLILLSITGAWPFVEQTAITQFFYELSSSLPLGLLVPVFLASSVSVITSCFDYGTKSCCFLRFLLGSSDAALNARIDQRYHEYHGALIGFIIGLSIAAIFTFCFLTSGVSIPSMVTVIFIAVTCTSVLSSVSSRIGRVIDGLLKEYQDESMNCPVPSSKIQRSVSFPMLYGEENSSCSNTDHSNQSFRLCCSGRF